jgi:hypothetical protein
VQKKFKYESPARRERRERIATACLQGMLARSNCPHSSEDRVAYAVAYADMLISALNAKDPT